MARKRKNKSKQNSSQQNSTEKSVKETSERDQKSSKLTSSSSSSSKNIDVNDFDEIEETADIAESKSKEDNSKEDVKERKLSKSHKLDKENDVDEDDDGDNAAASAKVDEEMNSNNLNIAETKESASKEISCKESPTKEDPVHVQVAESLSRDAEEGYVQVTHSDYYSPDAIKTSDENEQQEEKDESKTNNEPAEKQEKDKEIENDNENENENAGEEKEDQIPEVKSEEDQDVDVGAANQDNDDAILEGILSGSDELSAKYRLHTETSFPYPDAPPSTPSEGPIPLSQFDHVSLRSSFEEDANGNGNENDVEVEEEEAADVDLNERNNCSPILDASGIEFEQDCDQADEIKESAATPDAKSPSPVFEGGAVDNFASTSIPVKSNALSSTPSSSDPLTHEKEPNQSSNSQRRPSFKDTAEYTFMESLPNSQSSPNNDSIPHSDSPPPPVAASVSTNRANESSTSHSSEKVSPSPTPLVEQRVLIALTLRVLYELRLRRVLDQKTIGEVKEELFGSNRNLTQAAEAFLTTRDLDPLLSTIFKIVGMDGLV